MKTNMRWKILLLLGLCPFAAPFLWWLYQLLVDPWPLFVWLMLYSYLYWPTYLIGLVLVVLALCKRKG